MGSGEGSRRLLLMSFDGGGDGEKCFNSVENYPLRLRYMCEISLGGCNNRNNLTFRSLAATA